jgi:hypothetical protein
MNKLLIALAAAAFALSAQAADDKKATAQQSKMTTCNKDAGEKRLEGDVRKAFMKECLSAKPAVAAAAKPAATAASPACEKSADDKKLAGAARASHIKKCMADTKKG